MLVIFRGSNDCRKHLDLRSDVRTHARDFVKSAVADSAGRDASVVHRVEGSAVNEFGRSCPFSATRARRLALDLSSEKGPVLGLEQFALAQSPQHTLLVLLEPSADLSFLSPAGRHGVPALP